MLPLMTGGIVDSPKAMPEVWSDDCSSQGLPQRLNRYCQTQADQDKEDSDAKRQAEQKLERSWMDRLQLITVISTFFAATEAQLLSTTTPSQGTLGTIAEQVTNAALTGALVLHSFAATLSFTAAFVLVRFMVKEASKDNPNDIGAQKQKIWSSNPHVAMQRVGYRQQEPPMHLLRRFNTLCIYMTAMGFILAGVGILCFVWTMQAKSASIFASVCLGVSVIAALGVLFVPAEDYV